MSEYATPDRVADVPRCPATFGETRCVLPEGHDDYHIGEVENALGHETVSWPNDAGATRS